MSGFDVSIYILNYNGRELLPECLPSILAAARASSYKTRVRVIDNLSTDNSLEILARDFPDAEILRASANDFLCSFNEFVFNDTARISILMNNDIKVDPDFIDPLVKCLDSYEDAFFASSYCRTFDKSGYEGGISTLVHKFGWWGTLSDEPQPEAMTGPSPLFTISIGACIALKTELFKRLKGYSRIYLPGILEDLDLCYRAWKCGFKGYFVPESRIYHKGQASFKPRFGLYRIRKLATRNTMLFIWKNIHDRTLLLTHLLWLPARLTAALLRLDFAFISGVFSAIMRLLPAAALKDPASEVKITDRELIDLFRKQKIYLSAGIHG